MNFSRRGFIGRISAALGLAAAPAVIAKQDERKVTVEPSGDQIHCSVTLRPGEYVILAHSQFPKKVNGRAESILVSQWGLGGPIDKTYHLP